MDQASVSTEPGLEIGPVNCGKLLNCNEFMKYVVQIVNKERRSFKKIIIIIIIIQVYTGYLPATAVDVMGRLAIIKILERKIMICTNL